MLANKLALSLPTINNVGAVTPPTPWDPSDESGLIAWYKNKVGVIHNGGEVAEWNDSSGNGHLMVSSGDANESPTYDSVSGELYFIASRSQHLQLEAGNQIELPDTYTIGFKLNAQGTNNTILGDNTSSNEYFKIVAIDQIRIKTSADTATITTDGDPIEEINIVLTRDTNGVVTMYLNSDPQSQQVSVSGSTLIDAIGIRATNLNSFEGGISEIQIYDESNQTLTSKVNTYLLNI